MFTKLELGPPGSAPTQASALELRGGITSRLTRKRSGESEA